MMYLLPLHHSQSRSRHFESFLRHSERSEESPSSTLLQCLTEGDPLLPFRMTEVGDRHGERSVAIQSSNKFRGEVEWLDPRVALCAPQDDDMRSRITHGYSKGGVW